MILLAERDLVMGAFYDRLTYLERLTISDGRYRRLTVSREIKRLGPYWQGCSPAPALHRALAARRESREGARKLHPGSPLFDYVVGQLREGWSPLEIAGRLRTMDEADRPGTVKFC